MPEALYVLFRYGPLGVADVLYVKIHKNHRTTWVRDRDRASVFRYSRAIALQRGRHSAGGDDLVLELVRGDA
jgi:hypothetical protein